MTVSSNDRAPARSRAATRERILASGTSLFADRGLHEVTTHDIASDAGVAAGTFYLHFPDKQTLFREIVFQAVGELRQGLQDARGAARGVEQVVRAQADVLLSFAEQRADLVRILFGRDSEARGLGADVLDHLAEGARERIADDLKRGRTPGSVDPDVAAQAIVGMWSHVLAWWVEDTSRATREQLIDTLTTFELSGVFPVEARSD
jgi:AcrR family transcriptional regulator